MKILTKTQIQEALHNFYQEHWGEREEDIWYSPPAANIWMFRRDNRIIILKCHILTGIVTEQTEEFPEEDQDEQ